MLVSATERRQASSLRLKLTDCVYYPPMLASLGSLMPPQNFLKCPLAGDNSGGNMMYNQGMQKEAASPETKITAAGIAML